MATPTFITKVTVAVGAGVLGAILTKVGRLPDRVAEMVLEANGPSLSSQVANNPNIINELDEYITRLDGEMVASNREFGEPAGPALSLNGD